MRKQGIYLDRDNILLLLYTLLFNDKFRLEKGMT